MSLISSLTRRFTGGGRTASPGPTSRGAGSPSRRGGGGVGRIIGQLTGRGRRL